MKYINEYKADDKQNWPEAQPKSFRLFREKFYCFIEKTAVKLFDTNFWCDDVETIDLLSVIDFVPNTLKQIKQYKTKDGT